MNDNISPEEKLLRLIRKQKDTASAPEKPASISPKQEPEKPKKSLKQAKALKPRHLPPRPSAGWFIKGILALSCVYLVIALFSRALIQKQINFPEPALNNSVSASQLVSSGKKLDEYLMNTKNHQIFGKPEAREAKPAALAVSESLKNISLVGVISGENPQAVIEDRKAKKTFYVTLGQYINEFEVEEIQSGKIILNLRGQSFELHL